MGARARRWTFKGKVFFQGIALVRVVEESWGQYDPSGREGGGAKWTEQRTLRNLYTVS